MEFPLKRKCIVYVAWQGESCLYVGMSRSGMQRPLTNAKLTPHRDKITKLDVHDCKNVTDALALESKLTRELEPTLALVGPGRPKKEKTVIIYVRVPERLDKRLRDEAHKEGRELSGKVRLIIESHYEKAVNE